MDGINRVAFSIMGLNVYWYGIFMAAAVLSGFLYASWESKRRGFPDDLMLDLVILMIPIGVIGARLYYVVFSWNEFAADPMQVFNLRDGGLAIYGTVIACLIALLIFCKIKKLPFLTLVDVLAPALVLGQAIGRWGNFFNQEVYGLPITNEALQFFPIGVQVNGSWYLALFFYEMAWNLLSFFILFRYSKKQRHPGNVFILYLALYGAARALLEGLRMNQYILNLWGLPVSQLLSIALVAVALGLLIFRSRKPVPEHIPYGVNYDKSTQDENEPELDESLSLLKGKSVSEFLSEIIEDTQSEETGEGSESQGADIQKFEAELGDSLEEIRPETNAEE